MTVTNFSIEYDSVNSSNTFTNGDIINGRIIVEVTKRITVSSLVFIGKGEARVRWSEHYGQYHHHVYWQNEKYYEVKHHLLRESRQDGTEVINKGRHVFPFSFQIPDRKLPSTFQSSIGKVVHKLKAELKQSMKLTKKTKVHFTFVSKPDMEIPGLMEPQYGCKDKSVRVFGSGNVSLDVNIKRMGFWQGEDIKVNVEINNQTSRSVKPKFILYEKRSFFAQGRRRVSTNDIIKEKMNEIGPSRKEAAAKVITIPRELPSSILNCSIIKLEYRLKIQLDIKCATDPLIKLPIVVMPVFESSEKKQPLASAGFGFEPFESPMQTQWSAVPPLPLQQQRAALPPVEPPPAYGAHALYPLFATSDSYNSAL